MLNTKNNFVSVLVFIIFGLFNSIPADSFAVSYYIAANGNDGNNGTNPATPWLTISKVNSSMALINAGDQILFRRGDKFFGEVKITKSGTSGNNIIIGSYGTGALPEITGKKAITSWTLHSGNIYRASVTDSVSQLYISEKLMTIARFPNSGFLIIDAGNGSNGFNDAALTQSASYWNGATCKIRTANWIYERKTVSAFSGGNVTFSSAALFAPAANFGYYFDNKLNLLDVANEWFYDKAAGRVYLYAPGGVNPNTLNVEGVTKLNGVFININIANITVQDLKITGYKQTGVDGYTGNYNTVQRCNISKIDRFGIRLNGINNNINNNTLEDNLNTTLTGVFTGGQISNNFINRTGLFAGYGENGYGYYGILLWNAQGTIIENNIIDSSGYVGIYVTSSAIVRKNIISYSLLTLNDGGGISVGNADGLQITDNIISNSIGNTISSKNPALYASGIYLNETVISNSLIQGNTVYACRYDGLIVDIKYPSANNIIRNNLLYNNFNAQIEFLDWSSTVFVPSYNTIVKGNIFYSLQSTQPCMKHMMFNNPTFSDFGVFDSNYYYNPYSEYVINRVMNYGTYAIENYSLSSWKNIFNEDFNSKTSLFSFSQYGVTDTLSSNLITNSSFNGNINNWTTWPAGSQISYSTNPLLDNGCMKINWTGIGNNESFTMSNNMSITRGNYYQLSFSCAGNQNGTFSVWGMSAGYSGFPAFFPKNYFSFTNSRKDYDMVFKADTTDNTAARLSYDLILPDSTFYIDNVNLYRVTVSKIDSTQKSKLFVNELSTSQTFSLNGINYKDLDGNVVTGSILLLPYSSRILVNDNPDIYQRLNLTAFAEGQYNSQDNITVPDTFKVYLRNNFSPYLIIDSTNTFLSNTGTGYCNFKKAVSGINYFIAVKHRNAMETWSSVSIPFVNYYMQYDFTSSASQAYGNNQIQKGQKFCFYSGDVNNDGTIDGSDVSLVENDVNINASGYLNTDLTGDNTVDASDLSIIEYNADNSVVKITP